jgi:hypothetical protein
MKKTIFLLLILFTVNALFAQKFQFGLKFNPHLSWLKSDNKDLASNKGVVFGFSYGLVVDYNFLENVGLNFEPSHVFYNCNSTIKNDTMLGTLKWKFQYIELPIALKMRTNQIGKMTYYGKIGLAPSINTSSKLNDAKSSKGTNLFNIGMLIGAGVHYHLGGTTVLLMGVTFHNGFLRFHKDDAISEVAKNSKDTTVLNLQVIDLDKVNMKPAFISLDIAILF